MPIVRTKRFRLAVRIVCHPNSHILEIPIDSYLFQRQVLIVHVKPILAEQ